ncbi:MAG: NAD-dependent epimerase/dehydratase family protein [Actinobacteria bacterium]|nr:NAD-dependent epimerase/dehydratase family protein [Actinomycetota bacterium]
MAAEPDRAASRPGPRPTRVLVTGAAGPLGRRVVAALASDPQVEADAVDVRPAPGVEVIDLRTADLEARFRGVDVVVHLASVAGPHAAAGAGPRTGPRTGAAGAAGRVGGPGGDVELARRVLGAAGAAAVHHLVLRSSAAVYGAWPTNPVPLTEEAPLRPVPELGTAVELAEIERLVAEWRAEHPAATVSVLRPGPTVAADHTGWLERALRAASLLRAPDDEPPAQFLHLDDLAAAVVLAVVRRLDGPFNVAPEGWLSTTELAALRAGEPRLRLPAPLADRLSRLRWRLGLAAIPPGVLPYARHPWVVASDRLRAEGWQPANTNEEAYVAATPAGPWATLSPRRRQEAALAVAGAVLAGTGVGMGVWLRRRAGAARAALAAATVPVP